MKLFGKFLVFFVIFNFCFSVLRSNSLASGEFATSYKVLYEVSTSGQTTVTQNIVLKNKTPNFYADKFELKIGSTKVEDIKANDSTGDLATEVKFENNLTTISVKFNQKVIGIEKTLAWTLSYKSNELANKSGQIWEVSIPRLAKSEDITDYTATVVTPTSFGPIAFSAPEPNSTSKTGLSNQFIFEKDQLIESGIAMSFGEKQVFSFSLDYLLENRNLTTQHQDLALPPDNNYQRLVFTKIEPAPQDVLVDDDNNFLAQYRLTPKAQIKVKVEGYVEVFSKPFRNIYKPLSEDDKKKYTQSQQYWEIDSPTIREQAQKLKTPKEIYKYVTSTLTYSQERLNQPKIERKGAQAALINPKDAVCMEFTDLFIAIARAAGIPAREVEGYAYTQNERLRPLSLTLSTGDILHAWPEYWDDQLGWVQIDPTWGATSGGLDYFNKLDFNHITFVSRGLKSTYPYPAGSYKSDTSKKAVQVEFSQDLPRITTLSALKIIIPEKIIPIVPVAVTAHVQNEGTSSILNGKLTLTSQKLKNLGGFEEPQPLGNSSTNTIKIDILPPFAKRSYLFRLQSKSLWTKTQDMLNLEFDGNHVSASAEIIPIYSFIFIKGLSISLLISFLIITTGLFLYKKTRSQYRRKRF